MRWRAAGRRRASSPWQTSALTKNTAQCSPMIPMMILTGSRSYAQEREDPDRIEDQDADQREDEERLQADREPVRDQRPALEHDHEGQKIERERHHPEQRHRRHVGRDVGRHRDQQPGRHGRERAPGEAVAPGWSVAVGRGRLRIGLDRRGARPADRGHATPGRRSRRSRRSERRSRSTRAGSGRSARSGARPRSDRRAAPESCRHCSPHTENRGRGRRG